MPSDSAALGAPPALARLRPVQLDALRELANVGAGHAATSLSRMTGRRVDVGVPSVTVAAVGAVKEMIGHSPEPVTLVRMCTAGPLRAGLLVLFPESAARELVAMLLGSEASDWPGPMGTSAILEIGNVLGGAYLAALSGMTGWTIPLSTPELLRATADQLISDIDADRPASNYALCLETRLTVAGAAVRGHVLLFPLLAVLPSLLEVLALA